MSVEEQSHSRFRVSTEGITLRELHEAVEALWAHEKTEPDAEVMVQLVPNPRTGGHWELTVVQPKSTVEQVQQLNNAWEAQARLQAGGLRAEQLEAWERGEWPGAV